MITPYTDKEKCTGCTACKSVCPTQAIEMCPDQDGFLYPAVNAEVCTMCGLCQRICPIEIPVSDGRPLATYAAIHRDECVLKNSSSGGHFRLLHKLYYLRRVLYLAVR